jgi:hypothetical protein
MLTVWFEVGVGTYTGFVRWTNDDSDTEDDVSERFAYEYLNV